MTQTKSSQGSLASRLVVDNQARAELLEVVRAGARQAYIDFLPRFRESLTPFQRELYDAMQNFPYNPKDWWRDPHDIIVVRSLALIVERERTADRVQLPDWLVTCALLHDRGYGILPLVESDRQKKYLDSKSAHWESLDSRILHSRLSRLYAAFKLFNFELDRHEREGFEDYLSVILQRDAPWPREKIPAELIDNRTLFLEVVEKHDHALIGKYGQMPEMGRSHFDADSLYSISISSFIKDYLSYANDPDGGKGRLAAEAGLCAEGAFTPSTLLVMRLARYYPGESELPPGWDVTNFPLVPSAARLTEGGRCYQPYTVSARAMTDRAFMILAECCRTLDNIVRPDEFERWYRDRLSSDFTCLF